MTGDDIKALRGRLGITPTHFAQRIGCTAQTVYNWESGSHKPKGFYLTALRRLQKRTIKQTQ